MSRTDYAGRRYGTTGIEGDVYQGRMRSRVEEGKIRGRSDGTLIIIVTDERPTPEHPPFPPPKPKGVEALLI